MTVGAAGIGQFEQTGGTTGYGLLTVGSQQGGVGTVNLTGGTMNDDAVIGDAAPAPTTTPAPGRMSPATSRSATSRPATAAIPSPAAGR